MVLVGCAGSSKGASIMSNSMGVEAQLPSFERFDGYTNNDKVVNDSELWNGLMIIKECNQCYCCLSHKDGAGLLEGITAMPCMSHA